MRGVFLFLFAYTDSESTPKGEPIYEDRRCEIAADPTADPAEGVWDQKAEKELTDRQREERRRRTAPLNFKEKIILIFQNY